LSGPPRYRGDLLGFTLLEVMVAVAILGLSLTVILSAQVGLFATGTYNQHVSVALGLARCKMTELEEQYLKLGFPRGGQQRRGGLLQRRPTRGFHLLVEDRADRTPPAADGRSLRRLQRRRARRLGPPAGSQRSGPSGR
jgi:prepilin-type N-terminal cleavage/methylation domain-containing protein